jgi:hypothetical protein
MKLNFTEKLWLGLSFLALGWALVALWVSW